MAKTTENKNDKETNIPFESTEFYKNGVIKREKISAIAEEREDAVILLDGLDAALEGYSIDINDKMHAVYSVEKCLEVFMSRDGMDYVDALDFYQYNTERAIPYMASHGNLPIMYESL